MRVFGEFIGIRRSVKWLAPFVLFAVLFGAASNAALPSTDWLILFDKSQRIHDDSYTVSYKVYKYNDRVDHIVCKKGVCEIWQQRFEGDITITHAISGKTDREIKIRIPDMEDRSFSDEEANESLWTKVTKRFDMKNMQMGGKRKDRYFYLDVDSQQLKLVHQQRYDNNYDRIFDKIHQWDDKFQKTLP